MLRHDNADLRLTPVGRELGLVDDEALGQRFASAATRSRGARGTRSERSSGPIPIGRATLSAGSTLADALRRPDVTVADVLDRFPAGTDAEIAARVEIELKMDGYVRRQQLAIDRAAPRRGGRAARRDLDYARDPRAVARSAREARARAAAHAGRGGAHPGHHAVGHRARQRPRPPPHGEHRRPRVTPLPDAAALAALREAGVEDGARGAARGLRRAGARREPPAEPDGRERRHRVRGAHRSTR